jgi:hypothetical protein
MAHSDSPGSGVRASLLRGVSIKVVKAAPAVAVGLLGVLLLFEASYRTMLFDAYGTELALYNSEQDLEAADGRETLLCMGDSLTAGLNSWPAAVRERRSDLRVINAGIPGSGVLQANLVAPRRFRSFRPGVLVYQVNVSNDLVNLRYPVDWSRLNPVRNAYWTVAHRLRSVEYLNYRAGQAAFALRNREFLRDVRSAGLPVPSCDWDDGSFRPEVMTPRVGIYLRAEPAQDADQILVRGRRAEDFRRLVAGVRRLLEHCEPPSCRARVLVVPHAVQVEPQYAANLRALGSAIPAGGELSAPDYPFLQGLRDALGGETVIDPLPALRRRAASGDHVYFRYDPHLNACGQQVLAEAVLEAIQ